MSPGQAPPFPPFALRASVPAALGSRLCPSRFATVPTSAPVQLCSSMGHKGLFAGLQVVLDLSGERLKFKKNLRTLLEQNGATVSFVVQR